MIPYIVNTVLSCFFMYMGTKNRRKKRKVNLWVVFAILIPSILAGARDISVGTDTSIYGIPFFTYALSRNFKNYMLTAGGDPLWLVCVYGISRITTNVFWELFLIEFIILFFTYKALKQYDLGKYTWIGFLVFHLMFYSFTLNLMRQFVCLSIILYSFKFIKQCKFKVYFVICCILVFIQKTAIVAITLYPIYHLVTGNYEEGFLKHIKILNKKFIFKGIIITGTCLVVIFASNWIVLISNLTGLFSSQVEYMHGGYDFIWHILIYLLPLCVLMLVFEKYVIPYNHDFEFFILVLIIFTILWQLQGISRESYRMGFYFGYFLVISIPALIKEIKRKSNRRIVLCALLFLMTAFYIDYFVIQLYNETYPYTSTLLGIG